MFLNEYKFVSVKRRWENILRLLAEVSVNCEETKYDDAREVFSNKYTVCSVYATYSRLNLYPAVNI